MVGGRYSERNILKRVFSRTLGTILGTILICNSLIGSKYSVYRSSTVELTSTNLLFYTVLDSSMLSGNTVYNQYII